MLHKTQPNLSHLCIFGSCCFARIPSELQEKLGPHSHKALFMGYPPEVKAWCCRDATTGVFFNSCDIIFDEYFTDQASRNSDKEDDTPAIMKTLPVPPPDPAPSAPPHAAILRRSGRIPVPTECGQLLKGHIAADKAQLSCQCELRATRINGVPPPPPADAEMTEPPIVTMPTHMPGPSAPVPTDPDAILPDSEEVGFLEVITNLIIVEVTSLSIHSDTRRNPLVPGYNLAIPPVTYDEAM